MSLMRRIRQLRSLIRRSGLEREMDEEIRFHLDAEASDLERSGLSPAEARREARVRFGGVERFKEEARGARGVPWLDYLWRDLRQGVRSLLRSPSFTTVAGLTLALGIGAHTAIFSVVRGVLLSPLPFRDSDRVVLLWGTDPARGVGEQPLAYPAYLDFRSRARTLDDVAIWRRNAVVIQGESPERVVTELASGNLFALLGVEPLLGSVFDERGDQAREPVAVISHALWQRRFGGDPNVLGETLVLSGDAGATKQGPRSVRVIGVMPVGFSFPTEGISIWEPAGTYWRFERERGDRAIATWNAVGRLAPGATPEQASDELSGVAREVSLGADGSKPGVDAVRVIDYVTGSDLRLALWILLGAVGLVLLIACANVASLSLARGLALERELATRIALGAGRGAVLRQRLLEGVLLVSASVVAGAALASVATRLLVAAAPRDIPRLDQVGIDRSVLLFTVAISAAAGLICALLPALRTSVRAPARVPGALNGRGFSETTGSVVPRQMLVITECALAVVLLTGAGLMLRSYARMSAIDPGFRVDGLLTLQLMMPRTGTRPTSAQSPDSAALPAREQLLIDVAERVRALPAVVAASTTTGLIDRADPELQITIPGKRPGGEPEPGNVGQGGVSPGLMETLGVPLLAGRMLDEQDYLDRTLPRGFEETALVNQSFARVYFSEGTPVGRRFRVGEPGPKEWWVEVVGVVADFRRRGIERAVGPEFFTAVAGIAETQLIVRAEGEPDRLVSEVEAAVRSAGVAVVSTGMVEAQLGTLSAQRRFQTTLLGLFAGLALLLAAVGIYGLMHYTVSRRMPELGVRMALGGSGWDVARLMLRDCLWLTLAGATCGLVASAALTRVLEHLLFEVHTTDPVTLGGVALLLTLVALAAALLPTLRATRADPTAALRSE